MLLSDGLAAASKCTADAADEKTRSGDSLPNSGYVVESVR